LTCINPFKGLKNHKEQKMANKKFWLKILAIALVLGMTVAGCSDGSDNGSKDSDNNKKKPILRGVVSIDNMTPVVGETLTAGFEDFFSAVGTATWEWIRGTTTIISGATTNSYTAVAADAGQTLKARVSYSGNEGNEESFATNPVIGIPSTANVSVSIETIVDTTRLASSDKTVFSVNVYLTLSDGVWKFGNTIDYNMVRSWVTMSGTPDVNNLGTRDGEWNFVPFVFVSRPNSSTIPSNVNRQKLRLNYEIYYPQNTGNISISGLTATLDATKLTQMKDYTNVTGSLSAGSPSTASSSEWVPAGNE
jgi:hypothetical protein